jgi:hypothetical protein
MKNFRNLTVLLTALLLGACGGGGDDPSFVGGGGGGGGDDDGGANTDQGVVTMGSGSVDSFSPQIIDFGGVTTLAAGGSVGMSVLFVVDDGSGALTTYTEPVDVTFSSSCISGGLATVTPTATVTTVAGRATATFVAQGCDTGAGSEVVTARATVATTSITAQGSIAVAGADIGSVEFVSADPEFIGLKGTGGQGIPEQATVRFRVVDESKGPVAGKTVAFALNTSVGGITFIPATAISDANGIVQTVVQSGTVATTVRVTATEQETNISTQSSGLTISTGIPHQNAFSISLETCNTDTFGNDNVVVPVSVRLSDRFQNPVPDGTAVSFTAEGGQIESACATTDGGCIVNWTSSDPRPGALIDDLAGQTGGRVTIVATAIGEESFLDQDGDFVYDAGEAFGDLEERFRDDNENQSFDIGVDGFFMDFNLSGTHDAADGGFNGLLCSSGCSADPTLGISAEAILVMGTEELDMVPSADPLVIAPGDTETITIAVRDLNGNFPAAETVIEATETTNGSLVGKKTWTVPDSCGHAPGPYYATFDIEADDESGTGTLFIEGTTPGGLVTVLRVQVID